MLKINYAVCTAFYSSFFYSLSVNTIVRELSKSVQVANEKIKVALSWTYVHITRGKLVISYTLFVKCGCTIGFVDDTLKNENVI